MHCLFFDMRPKPGHMDHYFDHVARLKPILAQHDGLIYLERFRPLDEPEALLSHQIWRDEAAIARWRQDATHRASQSAGRRLHFDNYRIQVGAEVSRTEMDASGRFVVAAYGVSSKSEARRVYESVTRPGYRLALMPSDDAAAAHDLYDKAREDGADSVRLFQISRDYTMHDRAEAPAATR